ncbi:LIM domain only protein 7b isoform X3 [Pygocentrus nattereri]|uniref:LIM domain only protein 7b isoform X3 n=1 Tax=Pygocentrus nattereri TaxID=42514 RepID=UPI00081431E4|nr:LIM domain only protein 7b isoform X3 [Pygocentrus nattereri]
MEWREQSTLSCEVAFAEAQRWVEEVTRKRFGSSNFRSALENGVLLCDLINKLKPGIIKRVNRLSTPIAGLDNVNVFLKACGKLGLNDSQLFHPGDLQDVSTRVTVRREETTRRLKNVLITIYWLGRKAQADPSYSGPQLNFKAFEALLGVALSKTLEESSCPKPSVRDSGYGENWDPDKEDLFSTQQPSYRREDSVESLDSVESRTLSVASDCTLIAGSEGFGSDAEAEHCFRMSERSKSETHSAPSRERANIPIAVRRKRGDQCQDSGRNHASQLPRVPKRHSRHIGSKSMSDIALEPIPQESESSMPFDPRCQGKAGEVTLEHSTIDQVRPKHMQHIKTRVKDSEAKWQDDLDKWKSRRLSANSDLWKKKEEREQLEISSSRGGADGLRTAVLRGVQEESDHNSVMVFATCQQHQAIPQEPSSAQQPSSRALPSSQPSALREDPRLGSLASDEAFPPSEASPLTTSCSMPGPRSSAGTGAIGTMLVDPLSTPVTPPTNGAYSLTNDAIGGHSLVTDQTQLTTSVFFSPPDSTNPEEPSSLTLGSSGTELSQQGSEPVQRAKSVEGVISGGTRMSATLPRGFRKSEGGSRLSMGVTPRPFGVKASRVSSLPRIYSMDESHNNLIKGQRERPQLPASFTCQDKVTTPANEGTACSNTQNDSHRKKKKEDEDMDEKNHSAPKVHSFMSASIVASSLKQRATSESEEAKVGHTDMRVSLNQKPNSGRDFGFQAYWDSTGARIKSVQPGSPAQLCHLQAGDEIVAVGGQRVAEMSYEQWKASMGAALKEGSLLMEIRRHGQNDWSNDHLSLQFKSHKTINLTSMASTLIGHPEHCVKVSSCSSLPAEKVNGAKVNGHTVTGFPAKAVNKNIRDIPAVTKNKEYERIIMNNRKRRLAFFMQKGGSDSAISDLQVPSISAVSSRWSWDTEEERRRQEKWQMEQERLLQEKYQRDQERLEAEWRRAQLEAAGEECSGPEQQRPSSLSNGNTTPYTPPPFLYQSTSSTSLSQQAAEVRPVQSRQMTMQIETSHQTKEECDSSAKTSQWPSESYGFTRLTALDRKKSKSTPALDSNHKQDSRVSVKKRGRLSQAEKERQQILEEMRKKTPLHTDSSWIRQRSTCPIYKEPINVAPMRRYDSLDNLHSSSSLSKQFSTMSNPTRPHSALGNITPYRGYSGRCSLGPGAAIFSSSSKRSSCSRPSSTSSMPPVTSGADDIHLNSQQHGSASAAGVTSAEAPSPELRCESDTDSSSVTPATADSVSAPASPSDHSTFLEIIEKASPEDGSEVEAVSSA